MDTTSIRRQADEACHLIQQLTLRVGQLEIENAALILQVKQLQSAGAELSPATAKAWQVRFQASPVWDQLQVGSDRWEPLPGRVAGFGLKALLVDLTAVPTTAVDRSSWDRKEAERLVKAKAEGRTVEPARPAPTRKRAFYGLSWVLNQEHPGLGTTLDRLTKGLRGRLRLVIEIAFLLYREEAVTKLANEPEAVLQDIQARYRELDAQSGNDFFSFARDILNGRLGQEQEKAKAFRTLGLEPEASPEAVKAAYRQLARQHHPDAGGDAEAFAQVSAAYQLLTA